jgi:hypothetical protein
MVLTARERRQFVEKGWLVRQIDLDPALAARAIGLAWQHLDPRLVRDDPSTWHGEVKDSCHVMTMKARRGRVKLRECVNKTPWLRDMMFANPEILAVIADLLGPTGGPRKYIRGLYPKFPSPPVKFLPGGMDGHAFQVGCIMYLNDVKKRGGGFTLWEGSHRIMRFAFDGHASWTLNQRLDECRDRAHKACRNVELYGPAGTTIFWHHRLLHQPTTNTRREVRHALVGDFVQRDWESRVAEPILPDMWDGWAVGEADAQPSGFFAGLQQRWRGRESTV